MKRCCLLTCSLLVLLCSLCYGATYYIANDGNDSKTGVSEAERWATVSKVNSSSFSADDQILFKKGDTWREQLLVPSSGTTGHPVVVSSYGTGDKPKIYGSTDVVDLTWSNAAITGASVDVLEETFEDTNACGACSNFDSASCSCLLGSGSTVEGRNTDVARPDGSTHVGKVQKVSPNFNARLFLYWAEAKAVTYFEGYVRIAAEGLGDGQKVILYGPVNTTYWGYPWRVYLYQDGSDLRFKLYYYTLGGGTGVCSSDSTVSLDTWYKFAVYYNHTTHDLTWIIDGVTQDTLSGIYEDADVLPDTLQVGDAGDDYTLTAYFDGIKISSTGWPTSAYTVPANVWYASYAGTPLMVWLVSDNGTVYWGKKETALANVNALNEFYADGTYLFLHTNDDNATTKWSSIEAATRDHCATAESKNYVTLSNLECAFTDSWGLANNSATSGTPGTGWTITGNTVHHVGNINDDAYSDCIAVPSYNATVDGTVISNNTVYQCGNHCVYLIANHANSILTNTSVTGNTVYDCYHTGIDVMNLEGIILNTDISRNFVSTTSAYHDPTVQSNLIYISSQHAGSKVTGTTVDYNVLTNHVLGAIAVGHASYPDSIKNLYIRNNTIYGHSATVTNTHYAIIATDSFDDNGTINIQNNIVTSELYDAGSYLFAFYSGMKFDGLESNVFYRLSGTGTTYINVVGGTSYGSGDQAQYLTDMDGNATGTLFTDPMTTSSSDYNLILASPCVGAGLDVDLTSDYVGNTVGSMPDIGAYQSQFGVHLHSTANATDRAMKRKDSGFNENAVVKWEVRSLW